jgi:hypothetical protein
LFAEDIGKDEFVSGTNTSHKNSTFKMSDVEYVGKTEQREEKNATLG